jgi:transposase
MPSVTVLTGPERRRRWNLEERRRILVAAFTRGAVLADVARQFEISTSLIYKWRQQALDDKPGVAFAPTVLLSAPSPEPAAPELPAIIVELVNGTRLKIAAQASPALVTAALQALR